MAVSFVVASILLKTSKVKEDDDIEATRRMHDMKAESKGATPLAAGDVSNDLSHVRKIIVACDAGMGSSAMGAGVLRKKVQDAGLTNISVTNSAINSLPPDVDLVITHRDLTERAMRQVAHFADQLPRQRPVHQPDRTSGCRAASRRQRSESALQPAGQF
jgi:PTS system mannitol-specific IIC component